MKYPLLACALTTLVYADTLLSPEKEALLNQHSQLIEERHHSLRYNWIAPLKITGSYHYDKSVTGDYFSDLSTITASISQDIFRSGGISAQIEYADAKYLYDTIALDQQLAGYNKDLFVALLTLRKIHYQLEQSRKRLDNKAITIFIKRQLYDAGKTDITELNSAFLDQSSELKTQSSLRQSIAEERLEIAKLSSRDPDTLTLPTFTLPTQEEYLSREWTLRSSAAQKDLLQHSYEVTRSNYLPSLSLTGSIGHQIYHPKNFAGRYEGDYYSVGVAFSFPIYAIASSSIQEAKIAMFKEQITTQDVRRSLQESYQQVLQRIATKKELIAIISNNIALYNDLITITEGRVKTGSKTGYDLQTLQNSKAIEELEIKIHEVDIQLELAKLYFATHSTKDTL